MIVVMAAGLAANLSANPLDAVTTVTAQIVTILVGDLIFNQKPYKFLITPLLLSPLF